VLARDVFNIACKLGCDTDVRDTLSVSPAEIRLWLKENLGGPNIDDLRLDFRGTVKKSPWNLAVFDLLLKEFQRRVTTTDPLPESRSESYIRKLFTARFTRLKVQWKKAQCKVGDDGRPKETEAQLKKRLQGEDRARKLNVRIATRKRGVSNQLPLLSAVLRCFRELDSV
jgi:hypothetical protein